MWFGGNMVHTLARKPFDRAEHAILTCLYCLYGHRLGIIGWALVKIVTHGFYSLSLSLSEIIPQ